MKDVHASSSARRASEVITIVVGSHPDAERDDRPLAYRFQKRLEAAVAAGGSPGEGFPQVQIVTDLWYLNDPTLVAAPAIVLGTVNTNAAVAHLASRLPQTLVVDGEFEIQLDQLASDPRVCLRGVDAPSTERAVRVFIEKFLAQWLESTRVAVSPTHNR